MYSSPVPVWLIFELTISLAQQFPQAAGQLAVDFVDDLCASRFACGWLVAGPSHWVNSFPDCGGTRQSPINIKTGEVTRMDVGGLTLSGYDKTSEHEMVLTNNGHTGILATFFKQHANDLHHAMSPNLLQFTIAKDASANIHRVRKKRPPLNMSKLYD